MAGTYAFGSIYQLRRWKNLWLNRSVQCGAVDSFAIPYSIWIMMSGVRFSQDFSVVYCVLGVC